MIKDNNDHIEGGSVCERFYLQANEERINHQDEYLIIKHSCEYSIAEILDIKELNTAYKRALLDCYLITERYSLLFESLIQSIIKYSNLARIELTELQTLYYKNFVSA